MNLKLRPNKRITDVLRQPTWDIYDDVGYTNRWIVQMPDGTFCLAYNDAGATKHCDPQPTKELALEYHHALLVADKIEGKGKYFQAKWTETKNDRTTNR